MHQPQEHDKTHTFGVKITIKRVSKRQLNLAACGTKGRESKKEELKRLKGAGDQIDSNPVT